jgi:hypothetical protein
MAAPAAQQEQARAWYTRCCTANCSLIFPAVQCWDGHIHKHCCSTCKQSEGRLHTVRCFWRSDNHVLNVHNEEANWWTDEEWRSWHTARAVSIERRIAARHRARHQQQYPPQ